MTRIIVAESRDNLFEPLIERRLGTGESLMAVSYVDTQSDRVDQVLDPVGSATTLAYDSNEKISAITDRQGRATTTVVDTDGDLSMTEPDSETRTFTYTGHHMASKTSPRGDLGAEERRRSNAS